MSLNSKPDRINRIDKEILYRLNQDKAFQKNSIFYFIHFLVQLLSKTIIVQQIHSLLNYVQSFNNFLHINNIRKKFDLFSK